MRTFQQHLQEKLHDPAFSAFYEEERQLLDMALKIVEVRKDLGQLLIAGFEVC